MRFTTRLLALGLGASLGLFATSSLAAAAPKPITGKLSKPGFAVIALAKNGKANSVRPNGRRFKLKPPAKVVTLHLRAKDGTYGGPIVVAREKHGRRAILGVKRGAKLGKISVKARKGFAKVTRKPPTEFVDAKREARAKRGVPIGAGNFGRVRSRHTKGGGPGDVDFDGVPAPLDVDDDGDRILDNLDRSGAGGGARAAQGCGPNNFYCQPVAFGFAPIGLERTVNVNAGSTLEQINATLSEWGTLRFGLLDDSVELDCGGEADPVNPDGWIGGLSYCTRGGTGTVLGPPGSPFPGPAGGQFDPDGDGFGTLDPAVIGCPGCAPTDSFLAPRATTADIKTGDVLTQRDDGTGTQVTATLNFVFVTNLALVSYSDTAGHSATVSYPVPPPGSDCSLPGCPGGPGTSGNGFTVDAGPSGDIEVTLTFWHPQRQPIPGSDPDAAEWMDIGHLRYSAYAAAAGHPALAGGCPQATFSTTDPNLGRPALPLLGTGALEDSKDDDVSSPGNTLTYTLNLSECLAANGLSSSFDEPGEEQPIGFMAVAGATDTAETGVWFKRQ